MLDEINNKIDLDLIRKFVSINNYNIKEEYIDNTYMFYKNVINKLEIKKEYFIEKNLTKRIDGYNIEYDHKIINLQLLIDLFSKDNIGVIYNDYGIKIIDRR